MSVTAWPQVSDRLTCGHAGPIPNDHAPGKGETVTQKTSPVPPVIETFDGQYAFLSNFYHRPFMWQGKVAPTVEHHYQAAKASTDTDKQKVYDAPTPGKAKAIGQQLPLRPNWDTQERFDVMTSILRARFTDPVMRTKLLSTGEALLIEGNVWHDQLWGDCRCPKHVRWPGKSVLGLTLMRLRAELRADPTARYPRVALVGHRSHSFTTDQQLWVHETLPKVVRYLRTIHGTTVGLSGVTPGTDAWWAETVLTENVHLWTYAAYAGQTESGTPGEKDFWRRIRGASERDVIIGPKPDPRLLHCRSDLMLRDADALVAVHLEHRRAGGTVEIIKKALDQGKPIIRVNATKKQVTHIPATTKK